MAGTLYVVATPIGNLEDITVRALRVLREVAIIAAEDTRRTAHLLTRYGITTPTTSLHEHNEARKAPSLIARLQAGDSIAVVSDAGTPLISDPGRQLIRMAIDADIRIEPIPGASAVIAALAASGFQTHPFLFLGFPPAKGKDRKQWLAVLSATHVTVVFFESPHRIRRTLAEIADAVGDVPAVVARELTKIHESLVRGPISHLASDVSLETGELTVVLDLGQLAESELHAGPSTGDLVAELGQLTDSGQITTRRAVRQLARKHGRRPNEVYELIERARRLVK